MREILFRGKAECDNKWYIGWYIPPYEYKWSGQDDTGRSKAVIEFVRDDLRPDFVPVKEATVGQYTGLTDKKGAKIFEGDIVECCSEGVRAKGTVQQRKDGMWIIYPAWQKHIMWGLCPDENMHTTVEVIGNIHDNPELMEDK
jgi:uncharacterized phage protein (TIGR01671 family)